MKWPTWRLKDKANDRAEQRCENCGAVFIVSPLYAAHASLYDKDDEKPPTSRFCERCLEKYFAGTL
jgi:ribosomal protein S27AE